MSVLVKCGSRQGNFQPFIERLDDIGGDTGTLHDSGRFGGVY